MTSTNTTTAATRVQDLGAGVGDTIVWRAAGFAAPDGTRPVWGTVVELWGTGSTLRVRPLGAREAYLTALPEEPGIAVTVRGDGPQVYAEWDAPVPDGVEYGAFDSADELNAFLLETLVPRGVRHAVTGDAAYAARRRRELAAARDERRKARREAAERAANTPVVDGGATMHYPDDRMPYVVVKVSPSGAKVTLAPVRIVDGTTGHRPAGDCNGFPVWDHTYTPEELHAMREEYTVTAHRRKDGRYYSGGTRVTFDGARYYRNHAS